MPGSETERIVGVGREALFREADGWFQTRIYLSVYQDGVSHPLVIIGGKVGRRGLDDDARLRS